MHDHALRLVHDGDVRVLIDYLHGNIRRLKGKLANGRYGYAHLTARFDFFTRFCADFSAQHNIAFFNEFFYRGTRHSRKARLDTHIQAGKIFICNENFPVSPHLRLRLKECRGSWKNRLLYTRRKCILSARIRPKQDIYPPHCPRQNLYRTYCKESRSR